MAIPSEPRESSKMTVGRCYGGGFGVLPSLNEEQAILTVLHAACKYAIKKEWNLTHIETVNHRAYDKIRFQEHIMLDEDQFEVYSMFNTLHANNFKVGETTRQISCVPLHMNTIAEYMATYGMEHMKEFVETTRPFGNFDYYLQRDMGFTLPLPYVDVVENMRDGEVIDGPPPPPPSKKCRFDLPHGIHFDLPSELRMTYDKKRDFCFSAGLKKYKPESSAEAEKRGREKGKAKVMHEFCFNNDGLLSQEALNLLDGGNLDCFSGAPLDSLVGNGVYAKDVVRNVLMGLFAKLLPNLGYLLSSSADSRAPDGLLDVESVLQLMGFDKAGKVGEVHMLGPSGL